jgi:hypothetical protein
MKLIKKVKNRGQKGKQTEYNNEQKRDELESAKTERITS